MSVGTIDCNSMQSPSAAMVAIIARLIVFLDFLACCSRRHPLSKDHSRAQAKAEARVFSLAGLSVT